MENTLTGFISRIGKPLPQQLVAYNHDVFVTPEVGKK